MAAGLGRSAAEERRDEGAVELSLRLQTGISGSSSPAAEEEAAANARRSMTIFYNGRVCAVDVSQLQVIELSTYMICSIPAPMLSSIFEIIKAKSCILSITYGSTTTRVVSHVNDAKNRNRLCRVDRNILQLSKLIDKVRALKSLN